MKDKINIVELLKDCPSGMELDCASYDNVSFDKISDDKKATYPIFCYITDKEGNRSSISFTENGCESKRYGAKCVIFPKGKTTWEGFIPPCKFKEGDIVCNIENSIIIYKEISPKGYCGSFASLNHNNIFIPHYLAYLEDTCRLATEEEKEKLFKAIKDNGYKWNAETKTLEKLPKFKVGDRIKYRSGKIVYRIIKIIKDSYIIDNLSSIPISIEHMYNLVPNKFDINTLVPFESRVLVREAKTDVWIPAFYGFFHQQDKCFYTTISGTWSMCIPYNEDTKHLIGTTNDCDEYYKTWE